MSDEYCRERGPDGVYICSLVLNHKEDHTAKSFMDGFVYATWPLVYCRERGPDGVYICSLVLNHKEDHTAKSFMDGFVYATWPLVGMKSTVKVDYDPQSLSTLESIIVGELQVWMDRVVRDCDQEMACKLLYHYDLQRKRLDIIQATPPSRRTT